MNTLKAQGASAAAVAGSRSRTVAVSAYRDSRQLRDQKTKQRQAILSTYNKAHAFFPRVKFVLRHNSRLGEVWKLSGSTAELGNWVPEVSPTMSWREGGVWSCEVALPPGTYSFKCMLRTPEGSYVWESGDNRIVEVPVKDRPGSQVITYTMDVRTDDARSREQLAPQQGRQGQYSPMAYPGGVGQPAYGERANVNGHHVPAGAW